MKPKHVTIYDSTQSSHLRPNKLCDYIAWLSLLLSEVPEHYRNDVVIEVASYDGDTDYLVYYERPETPKEARQRKQKESEAKKRTAQNAKDRKAYIEQLERLRDNKFGITLTYKQ